jgi:hypothetical protein
VHLLAQIAFVLFGFGNDFVSLTNFLQKQLSIGFITQASLLTLPIILKLLIIFNQALR